jgi:hypothetical protein
MAIGNSLGEVQKRVKALAALAGSQPLPASRAAMLGMLKLLPGRMAVALGHAARRGTMALAALGNPRGLPSAARRSRPVWRGMPPPSPGFFLGAGALAIVIGFALWAFVFGEPGAPLPDAEITLALIDESGSAEAPAEPAPLAQSEADLSVAAEASIEPPVTETVTTTTPVPEPESDPDIVPETGVVPEPEPEPSAAAPTEAEVAATPPATTADTATDTAMPAAPETAATEPAAIEPAPAEPAAIQLAAAVSLPWRQFARPFPSDEQRPRIAIVITGLGMNKTATEAAIKQLPPEITLSFSPYSHQVDSWVKAARDAGHEALLDVPMEPVSYPLDDPGPKALLNGLSAAENRTRLNAILDSATGYVGIVNVMGSRLLPSMTHMQPMMEELSRRGLFFLDARASSTSVGARLATGLEVPRAINDRFLDANPSPSGIDGRLEQLERLAFSTGSAVAIAQPLAMTIERVRVWAAGLAAKGIVLAPITALANRQPDR